MIDDVSPLLVLQARAEARAVLYAACEFDLEQAITPLTRYALDSGITDHIGADRAFAIVKAAFVGVACWNGEAIWRFDSLKVRENDDGGSSSMLARMA